MLSRRGTSLGWDNLTGIYLSLEDMARGFKGFLRNGVH